MDCKKISIWIIKKERAKISILGDLPISTVLGWQHNSFQKNSTHFNVIAWSKSNMKQLQGYPENSGIWSELKLCF